MKFSMFVADGVMQINLESENEHEKKFCELLARVDDQSDVRIRVDEIIAFGRDSVARFYSPTADRKATTITIRPRQPTKEHNDNEQSANASSS